MLLAMLPTAIVAQESTIDRNVTVEREYQPVIEDAGKITTLPEVLEPMNTKQRVDYGELFYPLPLGRYLQSLPMATYNKDPKIRQDAFVRLGFGNYLNTLGDLTLPLLKKEKDRLDIHVNHLGTFGKRKFAETKGSIDYNHYFRTTELFASVGGIHRFFNYYGSNFSTIGNALPADVVNGEIGDDSHLGYHALLGFRSMPDKVNLRHLGVVRYENFKTASDWGEQLVHVQYGFDKYLLSNNRFGIDFDLKNMSYTAPVGQTPTFPDYSVLEVNPYFWMSKGNASVRLGLSTAISFVTGRTFNPSPDISAEWKVFPKFMALYGGIGGGFRTMTTSKLMEENPWVKPSLRVKDTYTPFKPYFGVKLKPAHFLLLDGFVEYNSIKDQYFFVNDSVVIPQNMQDNLHYTVNKFKVDYSDATLFRAGARLSFQFRNVVSSSLKVVSNKWTTKTIAQAWLKPALEADWNLDVKVNPKLTLSSNFYYEGKRNARLGATVIEMKPVNDLNLSASYYFDKTYSAFVKLNNVLNSKYEEFPGYDVHGFNFLLGGAISF